MNLEDFINHSIEAGSPFVSYRLPDTVLPTTLKPSDVTILDLTEGVENVNGFIVHPFINCDTFPALLLSSDNLKEGWELDPPDALAANGSPKIDVKHHFPELPESHYNHFVNRFINSCRSGEVEKVVFSRIVHKKLPQGFSYGKFFSMLCKIYPSAFVYILNLGNGQTWIGATPETLVASRAGKCETMSLAGTLASDSYKAETKFEFTNKEFHEQELVTEFIVKILEKAKVHNLIKHKLEVRNAGPVNHLQSRFSFNLPPGTSPINLASKLHPTPAVCGLPQQKALKLIHDTEPHSRAYYSGFLGPVTNKTTANLFVNLRCMLVVGHKAFIFAGGGITSESSIADEWKETNLKALTLLRIIEQQI